MDALILARWQFALTTIFHFFFVPLTIGLSFLVALMETIYVRTGQQVYKEMTKFWGKLLLINFAMGVVTGIVQEFQFGMNWSEYSRFVGDVFGAPLAVEALLAFYLESTFLGVWLFGWETLSRRLHLLMIWLVALATTISATWILAANSFMQEPVGFIVRGGRAEMTDFFALILNPHLWVQFPHTVAAAFTTAAFFVLGISAYHLARQFHVELFRRSFQIAGIVALMAIGLTIFYGHRQARYKAVVQPMKIAAVEGLFESENPASFSLLTIGDLRQRREVFAIRIPRLLSLLAYNQLTGEVKGMNDLQAESRARYGPGNYIPPPVLMYWSFRAMVGAGFVLLALAVYAIFQVMAEQLTFSRRAGAVFAWAIVLPYLANTAGWIVAEVGRQPWIVQGLLKTEAGLSPNVSAASVLLSLVGFTALYTLLTVVTAYLLIRFARQGTVAATIEEWPATASAQL
ncbi:MAG: cytochrome ubiquinol oxidase subunit I [Armatimonadota bacterium]|nr:cytochrome ubiquinol oxidase subunit I [Armatimonadota bacterium]MDR7452109.1 cytochrome ubiquinol oxidase subunit I [Armatimonadota bacterium]MDR7467833.1 cytochrome ubiquinol oxidase subunit I [Armatimonadota bacterium]MDR7494721.1 cytochrome ubiquinol oxidase subunit I [Armatimonadota bacterium]MDR7499546.1 cytochrome ubiquinol oxidase subunit I [Armatimonadota bacterium]